MKPTAPLSTPAQWSIAALVVLGLLGGSLIVGHAGYETSPRRGGTSTFVPAPQAWIIAGVLYLMSCLALLVLLRERRCTWPVMVLAGLLYLGAAVALTGIPLPR